MRPDGNLQVAQSVTHSGGRSNLEVVGSDPTWVKISFVLWDHSKIFFNRVVTQGDLVYRQYCLAYYRHAKIPVGF